MFTNRELWFGFIGFVIGGTFGIATLYFLLRLMA